MPVTEIIQPNLEIRRYNKEQSIKQALLQVLWNKVRVRTQSQSGKQKVPLHSTEYLHALFKRGDCISRTVLILGPYQSGASIT